MGSVAEVPEELYEELRDEALSRLPRDPDDWQVVALALFLEVDILTADEDFFGCGVATWTVDTLISRLDRRGSCHFRRLGVNSCAGFPDIEFNPKKYINCLVRSVALFVSLQSKNLLEEALSGKDSFVRLLGGSPLRVIC